MAPPRRGGGRSRSLAPPELRGALSSLLRTTLEQASVVREALERGARQGRARFDDVMSDRRRTEALVELGEIVVALVRRGRHDELAAIPEIADAVAAIDEIDARGGRDRDDEPGRDWVAPESRSRFDRGGRPGRGGRPRDERDVEPRRSRPDRGEDDGTVTSSAGWRPPRPAQPGARVWRPPVEDVEDVEEVEVAPEPPPRRPAPARGGIVFPAPADDDAVGDEDDLASYMHPDDVKPSRK